MSASYFTSSSYQSKVTAIPRYNERAIGKWQHEMRLCIAQREPLGLQIIEGEILPPELHDELQGIKLKRTASESLALTRSSSYTMTADRFPSGLFEEASLNDGSEEDIHESTDSDVTTRYDRHERRAHSGSNGPDDGASNVGDPQVKKKGGGGTKPTVTPLRRSSRLRKGGATPDQTASRQDAGTEEPDEEEDEDEGATEEEDSDESKDGGQEQETKDGTQTGGGGGSRASDHPPDDDKEEDEDPGKDKRFGDRDRLEARRQKRIQRERALKRAKERKAKKQALGLKTLVNNAKAVRVLVAESMDPRLWKTFPAPFRNLVYNKANNNVWTLISKSLGYVNKHLIGQLREGDGKAAWHRLITLHAEETNGAETHYLNKLLKCCYAGRSVGHIREYAEQLQEINKQYKLAAKKFIERV